MQYTMTQNVCTYVVVKKLNPSGNNCSVPAMGIVWLSNYYYLGAWMNVLYFLCNFLTFCLLVCLFD